MSQNNNKTKITVSDVYLFNEKNQNKKSEYESDIKTLGYDKNLSFKASQEFMKWVDNFAFEKKIENGKEVVARHWEVDKNNAILTKHKDFLGKLFTKQDYIIENKVDFSPNRIDNINNTPNVHFIKNIMSYIYNTKGKDIIEKYKSIRNIKTGMPDYFNSLLDTEINNIKKDSILMGLLTKKVKFADKDLTRIQSICTGSEYTNEIVTDENRSNILNDLKNRVLKKEEINNTIKGIKDTKKMKDTLYKLSFLCNPGHVNQQKLKEGYNIIEKSDSISINTNIEPDKEFNKAIHTAYWDQSRQKAYINFFNPKYVTIGGFSDNGFVKTNGVFAKGNDIENALYLCDLIENKKDNDVFILSGETEEGVKDLKIWLQNEDNKEFLAKISGIDKNDIIIKDNIIKIGNINIKFHFLTKIKDGKEAKDVSSDLPYLFNWVKDNIDTVFPISDKPKAVVTHCTQGMSRSNVLASAILALDFLYVKSINNPSTEEYSLKKLLATRACYKNNKSTYSTNYNYTHTTDQEYKTNQDIAKNLDVKIENLRDKIWKQKESFIKEFMKETSCDLSFIVAVADRKTFLSEMCFGNKATSRIVNNDNDAGINQEEAFSYLKTAYDNLVEHYKSNNKNNAINNRIGVDKYNKILDIYNGVNNKRERNIKGL